MRHDEILGARRLFDQEGLAEFFVEPRLYKKVGKAEARLAKAGEKIETIHDGKVETTNTAKEGDVVVRGPNGEEYVIGSDTFAARYSGPEITSEYQFYTPTGITYAVEWWNGPAQFAASWGELMIIDDGDYLCSPTEEPNGDLYRIEADAFAKTYESVIKRKAA